MQMLVQTRKRHRADGHTREIGEVYSLDDKTARYLIGKRLIEPCIEPPDWWVVGGRELRSTAPTGESREVIACLNIWNDLAALRQTAPSWLPFVDALVVADGPYAATGYSGASDDGLEEWLAECPVLTFSVPMPRAVWADQEEKRTALLRVASKAYPDAMLFIVDADEFVHGGEALRALPACDVGWVQLRNPSIYRRRYAQPRLVRADPSLRYDKRHHWLTRDDRLLATHQYGGGGWLHSAVPLVITNQRGLGQNEGRQRAKQRQRHLTALYEREQTTGATASDGAAQARESLRILQLSTYDPAGVASRLHTALNTTTPHSAVLGSDHGNNPFRYPGQFDLKRDYAVLNRVWETADIVHFHLDYRAAKLIGRSRDTWKACVIHHHGTMYREKPGSDFFNRLDPGMANLRLVSNLELLQYGEDLHWLPNPTPVAEYRRLRAATTRPEGPFRIAHSPSKRENKGTDVFLRAVERVQAMGLAVEAVLIEGVTHAESLTRKAECDAVFDSFWLGLQCSGLEGAAMGLPVIAGDSDVADGYRALGMEVPYTYANDEDQLVVLLERLIVDTTWRKAEATRVARYTVAVHDEAVVALRYLDLLDKAIGWRKALEVTRIRPTPTPAEAEGTEHQETEQVTVPEAEPVLTRTG